MNGPDLDRLLREGTGDDLRDAVEELAWIRARRACGLGPDDPPFSLHEDTVTDEHRSEYLGELAFLAMAVNEARMAHLDRHETPSWAALKARAQETWERRQARENTDNVTPIRPEDR